ncbi:MAG: hypothetical protein ABSH20_07465 [Tepidisphaeraceae bacterium]|jgi:hypothetical protein
MSTLELRRKIKNRNDALPETSLGVAADFLAWLSQHGSTAGEATKRATLDERLRAAERAIATGRVTPVERLKRKY